MGLINPPIQEGGETEVSMPPLFLGSLMGHFINPSHFSTTTNNENDSNNKNTET